MAGGERIKLLDFGIAKMAEGGPGGGVKTQANVIMGTPAYMSPEQCLGAKDVDGKTDVYALGVILFEMLAGRPPFVAERPGEFLAMHMMKPPPLLTQFVPILPSKLVGLVHGMLAKEPTARPNMEQVAAQLQKLALGGRDTPSLQLQTLAAGESGERATVQAKALGGRRLSGEISGSDLAATSALRVKKLGARGAANKDSSQGDGEPGGFDPTSPGDPDFARKLGSDAIADNASTIPVQSMRLNDIHPAVADKLRGGEAVAPRAESPASAPKSGPGQLSGANWVPMEIVQTDYRSTPDVPETAKQRRPVAPGHVVPAQRRLMLFLVLVATLLLVALTAYLLLRTGGQ